VYANLILTSLDLWSHFAYAADCLCTPQATKDSDKGRAIGQAVSRWLPPAAAWVRARVWSCGICGGQSGAGVGFLRVLRFPLPVPPHKKKEYSIA
jgi:hypothetical protein